MISDAEDSIQREPLEYVVERELPASRDRVWEAWTDPTAFASWFGGTAASLDVRPGGRWRVDNTGEPGEVMTGRYLEVVQGELLVMETEFSGGDTVMEMTFADTARGTRVGVRQACRTREERDGGREGSEVLLARCADYLAEG
jgi:uncharacterized protein YndB with AHSA1/START domain